MSSSVQATTVGATTKQPRPPQRRMKNRREVIISTASTLFVARGFSRVTMRDIAAEMGITDAALYRYFPNQRAILTAVMDSSLEKFLEGLQGIEPDTVLVDALRRHVEAPAGTSSFALLWHRDSRRLDTIERRRLAKKLADVVESLAVIIRKYTDLPEEIVQSRAWWCISASSSISYIRVHLDPDRLKSLLVSCLFVGVTSPMRKGAHSQALPDRNPGWPAVEGNLLHGRASRREAILDSASVLFAARGYEKVSMEDLASSIGVSAATLYADFRGKHEVLFATFERGNTWLQLQLNSILRSTRDPRLALQRIITGHRQLVQGRPEHWEIYFRELHLLPSDLDRVSRSRHQDYYEEWVRLLRLVRPEIDREAAFVLVQTVLIGLADLSRTPRIVADEQALFDLDQLSMCVLMTAGV
ncbi:MAG: helix-turn-helix domain-containing protein [Nocardioidaceae bacterium]